MNTLKQTNGYSLVEVLVAIAILLLAIVGPLTIAAKGLQSARYAREQTTAIFLAQEGIEAFLAARNDAAIDAIAVGDISKSWDWVSGIDASCFTATGCNIDFTSDTPLTTTKDCATEENCRLFYNPSNTRARYTLSSSGASPSIYIRKIYLSNDTTSGNKGITITSEVSWDSGLFNGETQRVKLTSAFYSLYE